MMTGLAEGSGNAGVRCSVEADGRLWVSPPAPHDADVRFTVPLSAGRYGFIAEYTI